VSAALPPLTDAQCARVAALLSTAKKPRPKRTPRKNR